mgnify:CR=1 FL=1
MCSWHDVAFHLALPIFFFYIGQELRLASKEKVSSLISPVVAALGGMLVPAAIYLALATTQGLPVRAFGAVIATDLPLALIAVTFFPSDFAKRIKHYLLALAVADDLGSIIVLALLFNSDFHGAWILAQILCLAALWFARKRILVALPIIVASWWISLHSGFQPTVIAALMGALVTIDSRRAFLTLEKFSYYICIPLFLAAALTDGVTLESLKPTGLTHSLTFALIISRIIGKPLGIVAGFLIAGRRTLSAKEIATVAMLGIFGLSVSLLFIHVATDDLHVVASATKAILYINLIGLLAVLGWAAVLRKRLTS